MRVSTLSTGIGVALAGFVVVVLLASGPAGSAFGPASVPAGHRSLSTPAGAFAPAMNVHRVTHPSAIPVRSSVGLGIHPLTHWWDGGYYGGATLAPHSAKMTMTIPDAVPSASEFYYVLLST